MLFLRRLSPPRAITSSRMQRQAYTFLGNSKVMVHLGKDQRLLRYNRDIRSLLLKIPRSSVGQLDENIFEEEVSFPTYRSVPQEATYL